MIKVSVAVTVLLYGNMAWAQNRPQMPGQPGQAEAAKMETATILAKLAQEMGGWAQCMVGEKALTQQVADLQAELAKLKGASDAK